MTVPQVLSIVTLGVADVSRSVTFYQALGWSRASSSMDEIAWFDLGGPWLGLFGTEALAEDAGLRLPEGAPAGGSGATPGGGTGAAPDGFDRVTLALNVPDEATVDAALAAAVEAGGTLAKPGTRAEWGGYAGYFADPDGHLWEVAYNPMFPIHADGRIAIP